MASDLDSRLKFLHRENVNRYRRLLKTNLADHERNFIERRLSEKEETLLDILRKGAQFDCRKAS